MNKKPPKTFLMKTSALERFCPSNSPQVAPFFFVKKQNEGLCPCQNYQYLSEYTVHNVYPLPLISNLIDKLKEVKVFIKFNIQ